MSATSARRWAALAVYVVVIYVTLPVGGDVGRFLVGNRSGRLLIGPGLALALAAGAVALLAVLRARRSPPRAYVLLVLAGAGYWGALAWLGALRIDRLHLPEYGVAAWLAWRALEGSVRGRTARCVAAAAVAALAGWGEELLQAVVPGRYYNLRDVAANATGAALGALVVAALTFRPEPNRPEPRLGSEGDGESAASLPPAGAVPRPAKPARQTGRTGGT
jgi:hypothetical protein